jgi:transcriptional antiterminator NusG
METAVADNNLQWYVVNAYSTYEEKVKTQLLERIHASGREEEFGEILVPAEQVVELVRGKKRVTTRSLYPGYILMHMNLTDENWHLVTGTPKVSGFVGGTTPSPVPQAEVAAVMKLIEEGASAPRARAGFEVGQQVKITDGAFADFNGIVEEVRPEKGTLKVSISIFGRATSVEMELVQVEKT